MATYANNDIITYGDWLKMLGPDQRLMAVVGLLNQENTVMQDMSYVEGNDTASNMTTQTSVLPGNTWRDINEAVTPTKALTTQVTDVAGLMEAWCSMDTELWRQKGQGNKYRAFQDRERLESMSQDMAAGVFYSNNDQYPKQPHGLMPRYNLSSGAYGSQIVLGGSSTANQNTSVWFVDWDETTISAFYPPGTQAGFSFKDWGETVEGTSSAGYRSTMLSQYIWRLGIYVANYKYASRVCNLLSSSLQAGTDISLIPKMIRGLNKLPQKKRGNRVCYCNEDVITALDMIVATGGSTAGYPVNLSMGEYAGQRTMFFRDVPIRRTDAISDVEAVVA